MAYTQDKEGEVTISGFETGIAVSPHRGTANIKNANIATETGEVMVSYGRTQNTAVSNVSSINTLAYGASGNSVLLTNPSGEQDKWKGNWITVSDSSHPAELANGTYFVLNDDVSHATRVHLSTTYNGSIIAGLTAGLTATFVLARAMGQGIGSAVEQYFSIVKISYNRYYVLDSNGIVWMYDSINDVNPNFYTQNWVLPDHSITYWGSDTKPSGIAVMNGTLMVFSGNSIWVKQTPKLGGDYAEATNAVMSSRATTTNPHYAFYGHQGRVYYTDGMYIGSIFPDTSLLTGVANIQSSALWSSTGTTNTIGTLLYGSTPSTGIPIGTAGFSRIPAVFFTTVGGTMPTALSANVVYYISYAPATGVFEVYAALTGGSALDTNTGSAGEQYYNTFWMVGTYAGAYGTTATTVFTPQRLSLPNSEIAQCLAEAGNSVVIGTKSNVIYTWNQVDSLPSNIVFLPESNVATLQTVNQIVYVFAGVKGNIYITDGSSASLVLSAPDYCAGVAGTPRSYIEPTFTWGGSAYMRGRVYFSILDQTSTKAGTCGGIWSFYPTQNLATSQDTGLALRQENISSYNTYSGYSKLIIPYVDQSIGQGPQYFSVWQNGLTSILYGIDRTSASPTAPAILETDLIPIGTILNKYTPKQVEYKLATPLTTGESVSISYRKNATDAFTSMGTAILPNGALSFSGYFNANFQGVEWLQLQVTLTSSQDTSASFVRLNQIKIR